MALVLRKAVLNKNVSLFKYIKGRSFATAKVKKNTAPLSMAGHCRKFKSRSKMHIKSIKEMIKTRKYEERSNKVNQSQLITPVKCSLSCPTFVKQIQTLSRKTSLILNPVEKYSPCPNYLCLQVRHKSCNVGCPCPFPCGPCGNRVGCHCLPPPCNTPPKCIQYMTGYYYYPYGTWFCGPYHVTGTCLPVGAGGSCPCPCPKCCAVTCVIPTGTPQPCTPSLPKITLGSPCPFPDPARSSKQQRLGMPNMLPLNTTGFPQHQTSNMCTKVPPVLTNFSAFPYSTQTKPSSNATTYSPNHFNCTEINRDSQSTTRHLMCHHKYRNTGSRIYNDLTQRRKYHGLKSGKASERPRGIFNKMHRYRPDVRPRSNYSSMAYNRVFAQPPSTEEFKAYES